MDYAGTILAITPFTLFYVLPYLLGVMPSPTMKVSVLSLGLLPLTFGYAIFRYRLMDVDLIFKRGMAYAGGRCDCGAYFAGVAAIAELVHMRVPSTGPWGLMVAVVVTALLFDPVRKWIQEKLDQYFFRTGYDYRRTLIEFGRDLSSETDLDKMLSSLSTGSRAHCWWIASQFSWETATRRASSCQSHLESPTSAVLTWPSWRNRARKTQPDTFSSKIAPVATRERPGSGSHRTPRPELLHSLPRPAEDDRIPRAWQDQEGDFLSSEDVELLEALAGYIGIAIQNGAPLCLTRTEGQRIRAAQRLDENIVESINVGVMAVDLRGPHRILELRRWK